LHPQHSGEELHGCSKGQKSLVWCIIQLVRARNADWRLAGKVCQAKVIYLPFNKTDLPSTDQGCQMVYFFKPKIPVWVSF
jgi:hypothetical protein